MAFDGTKRSIRCAVLLFVATLFSAAPASADPNDGAFVAALAKGGIVLPDQNAAIAMAHTMCAGLDQRAKTSLLAMKLMKETDLSMRQSELLHRCRHLRLLPAIRRTHRQFDTLSQPRAPADVINRRGLRPSPIG